MGSKNKENTTIYPDREMRWWGWGEPYEPSHLSSEALSFLKQQLSIDQFKETPPLDIEEVQLADPALSAKVRKELVAVVGEKYFLDDRYSRVLRNAGKSYPDLFKQRSGDFAKAIDAVVLPANEDEVEAILKLCSSEKIAVVPFGGGTSVVGGLTPLKGQFKAVISLDLARLNGVSNIDKRSLTARFGPGTTGPQAEAELAEHGLTLGHFPQSYEFITIGGCVATRSSGQASTGYGRIDELVVGLTLTTPTGKLRVKDIPASAAGPKLRELVVGSEGVLGVITEVTLRVKPVAEARLYEGWFFRSFYEGAEAFRELKQAGCAPTVARLSDQEETRVSMILTDKGRLKDKVGRAYLKRRGYAEGCVAIIGWEGSKQSIDAKRTQAVPILRKYSGLRVGTSIGEAWLKGRFSGPYLRDDLLDRGLMVETLETATEWSNLMNLHQVVTKAIKDALLEYAPGAIVYCHISHLYPSGASLYFTFVADQVAGDELKQWQAAKAAASDAITSNGGTITHHHAVGHDHAPWMQEEVGELGIRALKALKQELDPVGIMNPGKLVIE